MSKDIINQIEGMSEDISPIFYQDSEEKPFKCCNICERNLLDNPDESYLVEKVFKNYPENTVQNTLFEYAICLDCYEDTLSQLSRESLQKIEAFYIENMKPQERFIHEGMDVKDLLNTCMISSNKIENEDEFQICGLFRGDKMIVSQFPYAVSGKVSEKIADLLSNETIDELNRFKDKIQGIPPELKDIFKDHSSFIFA